MKRLLGFSKLIVAFASEEVRIEIGAHSVDVLWIALEDEGVALEGVAYVVDPIDEERGQRFDILDTCRRVGDVGQKHVYRSRQFEGPLNGRFFKLEGKPLFTMPTLRPGESVVLMLGSHMACARQINGILVVDELLPE